MKKSNRRGWSLARGVLTTAGCSTAIGLLLVAKEGGATLTNNSGQAYIDECAAAGVPTPPPFVFEDAFHNQNGTQWVNAGTLTNPFILGNLIADVFYYAPANGVCIALPRSTQPGGAGTIPSTIDLLGVICQGNGTPQNPLGKACFWDRDNTGPFENVEAIDLNGGTDLLGGDICTSCHTGENVFIVHPNSPLGLVPNRMPLDWVDPIVVNDPSWPENDGPTTLFDVGWAPDSCLGCHFGVGSVGGRFPEVSPDTPDYCGILQTAFGRTMPLPVPAGAVAADHPPYQELLDACNPPPDMSPQRAMSFDNPNANDWSPDRGTLSFVTGNQTEGSGALRVNASGYVRLDSIPFASWALPQIGTRLDLDVFVPPTGQPNQYWLGAVQLYVTIPSEGMFNAYVGQVELTPGGTGWRTAGFTLPAAVRSALLEPHADVRFGLAVNTPNGAPPIRLDNMRFGGTLVAGSQSTLGPVVFDFERGGDWLGMSGAVVFASRTQEISFKGRNSLQIDMNGNFDGRAFTTPIPSPPAGTTVVYRLYVPSGAPVVAITPYVMDQNLQWTDTWNANLPRDTWLPLTATVPANAALPLRELGVKIYLSAPYDGPIYLDAIQW